MFKWLKKLTGDSTTRTLDQIQPLLQEINALEPQAQAMTQEEMRARTAAFRQHLIEATAAPRQALRDKRDELDAEDDADRRILLRDEWQQLRRDLFQQEQELLGEILPEAFAMVREAAIRTIGQRHYDVQVLGGIVLHQGKIAEMKTGEGKTLTSTLPLYLNALLGHGAHLVTVNDYLARRDCGWMGQIFDYLGLSTAVIIPDFSGIYDPDYTDEHVPGNDERLMHLRPCERGEAYQADITYGTNNEFGFDYLRDNMVRDLRQMVQRPHYYAIVDEVDNILIDESRTPLIISAPDVESYQHYLRFARVAHDLDPADYEIDEKDRVVTLTEEGVDHVERLLGISHDRGESLYDETHAELTYFLESALKARFLFQKDVDYVVKDGEIVIVDEFTGRLMQGRRWSDGIHESIEAKEKVIYREPVEIQRESKTFATITFQNYFRLYNKLAGMTGTAATEQEEFFKIYGLEVVVVPTHRPTIRADYPDRIYANEAIKFEAVVREIAEKRERGQPLLVGTTSVERSEYLSRLLKRERIPHEVLNAKNHEREALIIAKAGQQKAVTIATNMAGRGTDIVLGPGVIDEDCIDPETGLSRCCVGCSDDCQQCFKSRRFDECAADVRCGLHVIGTERHEARRVDNQLRGRSGRQGDPGASRFYVSTEDDLIRRFGPGADRMRAVLERFAPSDDVPIEARAITRMIDQAQIRVEGYHFDVRKHLVEYDDVLNRQREVIYAERRRVLESENVQGLVLARLQEEIEDRTIEAFETLEQSKEYERDREAILATLEKLIESIHSGRQSREGSRRPLFPIIGQSLVQQLRQQPTLEAYEQLQAAYERLLQDDDDTAQLRQALDSVVERAGQAELAGIAQKLASVQDAPDGAGPRQIAVQVEPHLQALQSSAAQVLEQGLEEALEEALSYRRERTLEAVERTLEQFLYDEEIVDEQGRHLSQLYRNLTQDYRIPLPATMTSSRWSQMEPRQVSQEVLAVAKETMDDALDRSRQTIQQQLPAVVQAWRNGGGTWWPVSNFLNELNRFYRLPPHLVAEPLLGLEQEEIEQTLYQLARSFLSDREQRIGAPVMREIERGYLLQSIDREWVDYLTAMEDLRQGIGLQAYGQRDPLVEYRRRSYELFQHLLARMREQTLFYIFRASQAPVLERTPLDRRSARPARSTKQEESKKKRRRKKRPQPKTSDEAETASSGQRRRRRKR